MNLHAEQRTTSRARVSLICWLLMLVVKTTGRRLIKAGVEFCFGSNYMRCSEQGGWRTSESRSPDWGQWRRQGCGSVL